jgi:hypothetical protein
VFPHVKFFVDGEEMQGKTYFGTNPDDDNVCNFYELFNTLRKMMKNQ